MASSSAQAAQIAKMGMGMLFQAAKGSIEAVSSGLSSVKAQYQDQHEKEVVESLRLAGMPPRQLLIQALLRFFYMIMAGYKQEAAAAAQAAARRLVDPEKSSIPLDAVLIASQALVEEASRHGDFRPGSSLSQGLMDMVGTLTGSAAKDHPDRGGVAHEVYYAILLLSEACGGAGQLLDNETRAAAALMVESRPLAPASVSVATSNPYAQTAPVPMAAPPAAPVGATGGGSASQLLARAAGMAKGKGSSTLSADLESERQKAAKALYIVASIMRKAALDADARRQKALAEAEALLRSERARASELLGGGMAVGGTVTGHPASAPPAYPGGGVAAPSAHKQ